MGGKRCPSFVGISHCYARLNNFSDFWTIDTAARNRNVVSTKLLGISAVVKFTFILPTHIPGIFLLAEVSTNFLSVVSFDKKTASVAVLDDCVARIIYKNCKFSNINRMVSRSYLRMRWVDDVKRTAVDGRETPIIDKTVEIYGKLMSKASCQNAFE